MEKNESIQNGRIISRREMIVGAGALAVGAAVARLGLTDAVAKELPAKDPYVKLDPEDIGERAYQSWYKGFCSYAVADAILGTLQDRVGEPYTALPILNMSKWGYGGGVGWGTMCGCLIGTGIVTGVIAGQEGEAIFNEVIHWYSENELPAYKPKNPKLPGYTPVRTKSDSPLCHVSTNRWTKKSGFAKPTPQRKDRCARLVAETAMQTAMQLNDWADGKFKKKHEFQLAIFGTTTQSNCMDCHGTNVPKVPR